MRPRLWAALAAVTADGSPRITLPSPSVMIVGFTLFRLSITLLALKLAPISDMSVVITKSQSSFLHFGYSVSYDFLFNWTTFFPARCRQRAISFPILTLGTNQTVFPVYSVIHSYPEFQARSGISVCKSVIGELDSGNGSEVPGGVAVMNIAAASPSSTFVEM